MMSSRVWLSDDTDEFTPRVLRAGVAGVPIACGVGWLDGRMRGFCDWDIHYCTRWPHQRRPPRPRAPTSLHRGLQGRRPRHPRDRSVRRSAAPRTGGGRFASAAAGNAAASGRAFRDFITGVFPAGRMEGGGWFEAPSRGAPVGNADEARSASFNALTNEEADTAQAGLSTAALAGLVPRLCGCCAAGLDWACCAVPTCAGGALSH